MAQIIGGPGRWEQEWTCRGCRSIVLATSEDVRYRPPGYDDEEGVRTAAGYYLACPACGKTTSVSSDAPFSVKNEARQRYVSLYGEPD